MRLYLVRHGQAVAEEVNPQRPLSRQGIREAKTIAKFLKKNQVNIQLFYHSGRNRSQQTAEIIQRAVNPQGRVFQGDSLGPEDPLDSFLAILKLSNEDALIAGHLPYLSNLGIRLLMGDPRQGAIAFSTGTLAVLKRDKNLSWSLLALVTPDVLA